MGTAIAGGGVVGGASDGDDDKDDPDCADWLAVGFPVGRLLRKPPPPPATASSASPTMTARYRLHHGADGVAEGTSSGQDDSGGGPAGGGPVTRGPAGGAPPAGSPVRGMGTWLGDSTSGAAWAPPLTDASVRTAAGAATAGGTGLPIDRPADWWDRDPSYGADIDVSRDTAVA